MFLIIFCVIVAVLIAHLVESMELKSILIVFVIIFGIFGIVKGYYLCKTIEKIYTVETRQLVAVQDNVGIQGKFFLGCGEINSDVVYFVYYYKTADGIIKFDKILADQIEIIEEDRSDGVMEKRLKTRRRVLKDKKFFSRLFFIDIGASITVHYRFYIPKGSVITNYRLDLR